MHPLQTEPIKPAIEGIAAARVHGRYLVVPSDATGPAPLLIGFHGYGEAAEEQLDRLRAIPGSEHWLCVSIQGLHQFYQRSSNRVVASWMTRQNRELSIADNLAYVTTCLDATAADYATLPKIVFAGFSQGVGMAFRAAAHSALGAVNVIAAGGDIPPEIAPAALANVSAALIARGSSDGWYSKEKFAEDERRLRNSSVNVRALPFSGGHEWSAEVIEAAGQFLRELLPHHGK